MTKRMLIDAAQPEETRVAMTSGNRVEDFDFEVANRRQLKGNIYLARITRVEPSLQAAFIEYGGNRHGFLAFGEIHPDYYRIPMEDREALLAEQEEQSLSDLEHGVDEDDDDEHPDETRDSGSDNGEAQKPVATIDNDQGTSNVVSVVPDRAAMNGEQITETMSESTLETVAPKDTEGPYAVGKPTSETASGGDEEGTSETSSEDEDEKISVKPESGPRKRSRTERNARRPQHRRYRIQEVITRRQIMLVQVVKEERGNKGAALTTYLSLAGRYCVLIPNTPRGGGVSRKITSAADRKRLKMVVEGLDVPKDMAVIVRTAGSQRTKTEIKRDYEYLLRLWDQIRELTLESAAPCLVHEEANLIKRSIRDLYTRDIDEVLVEGEEGYRVAKDFMKMLVPSHARRVQPFNNGGVPLFHHFQVENQLDAIHASTIQLRSGGYIVINQTEALVAIDVNSGRATRERNIEETALKTNLEATEEVTRQLRLRDLAGLIVIDFIDMEESRNQHAVERKMKEMVKTDRARIQLGRISQFGLMELSRQRLRRSVAEASTQPCTFCEGTGRVRSIDSAALQILRAIEDEGLKQRAAEITVHVPSQVGFYILNNKRDLLAMAEDRYAFRVLLQPDDRLIAPDHRIERLSAKTASEKNAVLEAIGATNSVVEESDEQKSDEQKSDEQKSDEQKSDERQRKRRRRRRSGRRGDTEVETTNVEPTGDQDQKEASEGIDGGSEDDDGSKRRRRRGKRGGKRRGRRERDESTEIAATDPDQDVDAVEATEPRSSATNKSETPTMVDISKAEIDAAHTDVSAAGDDNIEPKAKSARKRTTRPRQRKTEAAPSEARNRNTGTEAPLPAEPSADGADENIGLPITFPDTRSDDEVGAGPSVADNTNHAHDESETEVEKGSSEVVSVGAGDQPQAPRRGWWNRITS